MLERCPHASMAELFDSGLLGREAAPLRSCVLRSQIQVPLCSSGAAWKPCLQVRPFPIPECGQAVRASTLNAFNPTGSHACPTSYLALATCLCVQFQLIKQQDGCAGSRYAAEQRFIGLRMWSGTIHPARLVRLEGDRAAMWTLQRSAAILADGRQETKSLSATAVRSRRAAFPETSPTKSVESTMMVTLPLIPSDASKAWALALRLGMQTQQGRAACATRKQACGKPTHGASLRSARRCLHGDLCCVLTRATAR